MTVPAGRARLGLPGADQARGFSGGLRVGLVVAGLALAASPSLRRALRSWDARVAVEGESMRPTLAPGDWLLVDPEAYAKRSPVVGELVVVADPREPERLLVKRVATVNVDGRLEIRGDRAAASTDSRAFGSVEAASVKGRPWLRYWPLGRAGLPR